MTSAEPPVRPLPPSAEPITQAVAARRRLRFADVLRLLLAWAASALALMIAAALLPGLSADSPWDYVIVAAIAGVVGLVLRPVMVEAAAYIGWLAVALIAVLGQAAVMYFAMVSVPGIETTFAAAFGASWIAAGVGTFFAYATTAGTDDALVASLKRRGKKPRAVPDPDVPGIVFVQLDGVPFPVMHWAVQSGAVPTVREWLRSGAYNLREWTPMLPCTTPASQLGILHGTIERVPAFRWYDREAGRVLVANRPADAQVIEARATNGRGLLYDDGASISNLFSGDAHRSFLTMSSTRVKRGSVETRRAFAWFVASPNGFTRSFNRAVAEIVKERFQARRQIRRRLHPRVPRDWNFAVLRSVTNGLLRDMNTALVAEEMWRGTRSIFVDYVDYDEIAHHAGLFRPESLAALDGLDHVLSSIQRLRANAARPYHIVVLSDHGQSQGETFADRYGKNLGDVCAELMAEDVQEFKAPVEGIGRAASIVDDVGTESGITGRITSSAEGSIAKRQEDTELTEKPIVLASGNLGLLYIPGPERWSLDQLESRWPALIDGLVQHPGIAFASGLDTEGVPWVIGKTGRRNLADDTIEGDDPLATFAPHTARSLKRAVCMPEAPDLYVNSLVEPDTLDIAAFEELVGAHGGFGGWQDRGMLLVPRELAHLVPAEIEGADGLHRVLVSMLAACGHRSSEEPVPAAG